MVPIAPHMLSNRPIVPDTVRSASRSSRCATPASLSTCSRAGQLLHRRPHHRCGARRTGLRFLHPAGWSYYATLRRKLALERASRKRSHEPSAPVPARLRDRAELEVDLSAGFSC